MGKEIITFRHIEIEKHKFDQRKNAILINNADISKIAVSSSVSFARKVLNISLGMKVVKNVDLYV